MNNKIGIEIQVFNVMTGAVIKTKTSTKNTRQIEMLSTMHCNL